MARLASHIKDESSKNMTRDFPKSSCKLLDAAVAAVEEEVEVEVESKTSFELQGRTTRKRGAPTERIWIGITFSKRGSMLKPWSDVNIMYIKLMST